MKTKMYLIIAVISTAFFIACTGEETSTISGTWNWVRSSGGFAGENLTPESTGDSIVLLISGNEVKKFVNDTLQSELPYTIGTRPSIFGGNRPMIIYPEDVKQSFEVRNDTLYLNDECNDCYGSVYVRAVAN